MNKKTLGIITIPKEEFRDHLYKKGQWFDELKDFWEIREVRLTDKGIQFIFWSLDRCRHATPTEKANPAELHARGEVVMKAVIDRAKSGEITYAEATSLLEQEPSISGIHALSFNQNEIFTLIHDMRFPSFLGSFFKPEYWAEPGAYQKMTKVELVNDDIEFTIAQSPVPYQN